MKRKHRLLEPAAKILLGFPHSREAMASAYKYEEERDHDGLHIFPLDLASMVLLAEASG